MKIYLDTDTGEMHKICKRYHGTKKGGVMLGSMSGEPKIVNQNGNASERTESEQFPLIPLYPASEAAVSWMIGRQMFKALKLAEYQGRVLGFMRKGDRPYNARTYIDPENAAVWTSMDVESTGNRFCIAIAPEEVKKTTEEVLQDLIDSMDTYSGMPALEAAKKHLAK